MSKRSYAAQTTACERDDLFFALYLILGKKLGFCGRDDLFFLLSTNFSEELFLLFTRET